MSSEESVDLSVFAPWLVKWRLQVDGVPFASQWSRLLPVRRDEKPLMLKAAMAEQEVAGSRFLQALAGSGAVRVMEREADAVLMERAAGHRSLGNFEEGDALAVLCAAASAIHSHSATAFEGLIPLEQWLSALPQAASERGGLFVSAADTAARLLGTATDIRPLHGDIHHGNVLDAEERGWLAIDPKGLRGDRAFDYTLLSITPDPVAAQAPGVIRRRARKIAELADLDLTRLFDWTFVQVMLYAAWFGRENEDLLLAVANAVQRDAKAFSAL
jgi:streptomycin 6-kinase